MNILKLILLIIYHPIDCMQIIKRENKFRWWLIPLLYGIAVVSRLFYAYTVHYPLASKSAESVNIILEAAVFAVPLFSWVICSYAMTALIDGESTFKTQLTVSCYCTVPYTVFTLISIAISYFMSLEELGIFNFIKAVGLIWMIILLLVSLMTLNDYSFSKAVGITILSLIAIVILWAVLLLLYALTVQMVSLIYNLFKEIRFKIG